ncbi:MAG: glycosyltransferase family 1 protein [Leptolyngbyaceae cyanobacterium SL_1_1]|nr:glycosyltransferase family 1 protein [Leptolyngbyaceae cyanobacterium SL_1_1]
MSTPHRWDSYATLDNRWNDYRTIDAVVAVRSLQSAQTSSQLYCNKPATKLYNVWLAGVPAILGAESAYRAERRSPLDYLEVSSLEELQQAVIRLQQQSNLRQAMVAQGRQRAEAITPERLCDRWLTFIHQVAIPAYDRWCRQPRWRQQLILQQRTWQSLSQKGQRRLRSLRGQF